MASEPPPAGRMGEAHLAFVFLSRLPLPRLSDAAARTPVARASWAFPLVGLLIGLAGAVTVWTGVLLDLPSLVTALAALAVTIVLSGALHEDGLGDVADGFGGGHTRDRKLEIMRDSRVGSYGVLALVFSIGLRATALSALMNAGGPAAAAAALMVAAGLSRAAIPVAMVLLPPARSDGLGAGAGTPGAWRVGLALILAGAATAVLLPAAMLAPVFALTLIAVLLMTGLARRQIGGHTGDVLGAVEQCVQATVLITLATLIGGN